MGLRAMGAEGESVKSADADIAMSSRLFPIPHSPSAFKPHNLSTPARRPRGRNRIL